MSETALEEAPVDLTEPSTEQPIENQSRETEFASVKEFSKEASITDRHRLASDLRTRRRQFRQSHEELRVQVSALEKEYDHLRLQAELAFAKLQEAITTTEDLKTARIAVLPEIFSGIKQFFHRGEIANQEQSAQTQQSVLQEIQARQTEIDIVTSELQEQIADDSELQQARKLLSDFYDKENASWQEYEAERQAGNVQQLSKEYGVFFVHGIQRYTPDKNSPLLSSVETTDKFRIAFALSPTLSASTIRPGDGRGNYWASQGFIIGNGTVTEAHRSDATTQTRGLFGRASLSQQRKQPIAEQVQTAIHAPTSNGNRSYNELVIDHPELSAVYATVDDIPHNYNPFDEERNQAYEIAEHLGLPFVVLQAGKPYRAIYDRKTHRLQTGEPIPPEELQQPTHIDDGKKQNMVAEIFEHSPFKPRTQEYEYVDARDQGRTTYLDIVLAANEKAVELPIHLATLDGKTIDYSVQKNRVVCTSTQFDRWANENIARSSYIQEDLEMQKRLKQPYTYITRNQQAEISSSEAFTSPEKYLEHLSETTAAYKSNGEHATSQESKALWEGMVHKIACHVYGFGTEAAARGNMTIAEQANTLADEYFDVEKIQDVMRRRVNDQGGFRATEEDFPELQKKKRSNRPR